MGHYRLDLFFSRWIAGITCRPTANQMRQLRVHLAGMSRGVALIRDATQNAIQSFRFAPTPAFGRGVVHCRETMEVRMFRPQQELRGFSVD
jgi:hypothetical protein